MEHNLIPLFMMISGSVSINDDPKMHYEDLAVYDHTISFNYSDLRTPFQLNVLFLYFYTRLYAEQELY